jgi:hypothetical protein
VIRSMRGAVNRLFGRGEYSIAIPVMDGPFQPNELLEEAPIHFEFRDVDNLSSMGESAYFTSGTGVFAIVEGRAPSRLANYPTNIASLSISPSGVMAVGCDEGGVRIRGGRYDGRVYEGAEGNKLKCPTASLFLDENTLIVANGSEANTSTQWKRDLMSLACSGSVWRVSMIDGAATRLLDNVAFASGLALCGRDEVLVSEAWRHRVLRLSLATGTAEPFLYGLCGYPSRIVAASKGGYWLAIFAARNQLVEFVLRERDYCERMMAAVDPEYWVAPAYSSGNSFREPLQVDQIKKMGVLKPWAPPRSYGMLVKCDPQMQPLFSWHSRPSGTIHGVTSMCEYGDDILIGSKGSGKVVRIATRANEGWE